MVRNNTDANASMMLQLSCSFLLMFTFVNTSHFRGGTLSWKPTGNGNEVNLSMTILCEFNNLFKYTF